MFQIFKKIARFIYKNKIILFILLVALYLRFVGVKPGFPSTHPDEAAYGSAVVMIYNKNLDPLRYDYPAGVALINYLFFKLFFIPVYWLKFYLEHFGPILDGIIKIPLSSTDHFRYFLFNVVGQREINTLFWGRYVTALFGVGVVLLIYLLGSRLFNKFVGLTTAFLVAVNFREVLNSHLGLPDIYNAFFLILSFIVSLRLLNCPSKKNYFISGLVLAVSFSVKYQIYGLIPFVLVHLVLGIKQNNLKEKLRFLFNPHFLIAPLTFLLFVLIINPYHLINWDQMVIILRYVSNKYGIGSNSLNLYPISYLYQYGVGKAFSLLVIFGIIYGLRYYFWKSLFLLTVILPFFFTFIYLSRGGFYTRNFITIIPLCLLFAGLAIEGVYRILKIVFKNTIVADIIVVLLLVPVSWSNIENSLVIVKTYTKDWNIDILSTWVEKNIPKSSRVAAQINVPLPVENVERIFYDPEHSFSIDEFRGQGADYAIANFVWATTGFYWWMNTSAEIFWKYYWNKPLNIMEYSYSAVALRELQNFAVFPVFKPWQAPDTDFLVVKIPKYKVFSKEEMISYDFEKGTAGWSKEGKFWVKDDGLSWKDGGLKVEMKPALLPSMRWQSPPLGVEGWSGFSVNFRTRSDTEIDNMKTGYVFVNFYKNYQDAKKSINRISVRLSKRNNISRIWEDIELVGEVPGEAKYITICFADYDPAHSDAQLDRLAFYKADVKVDYGGVHVIPYIIDDNNLFPVSHGNL